MGRMSDDDLAVANLLERIGHLSRSDEQLDDLYPAQWAALRYLEQANRFSRTPMALTRYLGTTRGTISQTLNALERKGYVERQPSERDKRSVNVALTKAGRDKLETDPILRLAEVTGTALGGDTVRARQLLEKMLAGLIAENGGRPFGQCKTCCHFRKGDGASRGHPHRCGLLDVDLSEDDSEAICVEQVA